MIDGLAKESSSSKQLSFLSFPVPECSCLKKTSPEKSPHASNPSTAPTLPAFLGATRNCPAWMNSDMMDQQKDKESEEELEVDDSASLGLFLQQSSANQEGGDGETNNKEETLMEDNEEVEGGDR